MPTVIEVTVRRRSPRKTENPQLNVKHLEHDAPNWYRLRVDKYRIRITFSLVYGENERIIEYIYGEVIFDDTENYVGIQQIGQRNKHTYIEARRRWRKSRR